MNLRCSQTGFRAQLATSYIHFMQLPEMDEISTFLLLSHTPKRTIMVMVVRDDGLNNAMKAEGKEAVASCASMVVTPLME